MTTDIDATHGSLQEDDLCKQAFVKAIKDALNVVSGKWKLAIVCTLLTGPKAFSEIERLLKTISPRMLSRELRELEINNVVVRSAVDGSRKYVLTPSGLALENVIIMMASWGQEHQRTTGDRPEPATDHHPA